ncbi:Dinucleoside triphosphate hydrolase [Coniosporium apollinis]|uniref:Bis(5'-adenosyl)-triphosphatase n=1 Tax=Coniosporium apollinis TaxID=61459 RepID=A0ABQ9P5E7_9PEZI|nr:Dinucleoside triphosphate hydrolase [Coniosporium apollinis]
MPPPRITKPIYFGPFLVTSQVFHTTPHTFALVNLKPILPGHVLISPHRRVPRLRDLTPAEISDLFLTVQRVSRMIERVFNATALNIAVQDGADAGQSVPHFHAHVIPRREGDLEGGGDAVYRLMEGEEGDVGGHLEERERERGRGREERSDGVQTGRRRGQFPAVDADEVRKPRSEEEMRREAEWFAEEMEKENA